MSVQYDTPEPLSLFVIVRASVLLLWLDSLTGLSSFSLLEVRVDTDVVRLKALP